MMRPTANRKVVHHSDLDIMMLRLHHRGAGTETRPAIHEKKLSAVRVEDLRTQFITNFTPILLGHLYPTSQRGRLQ